jgi:hypothetical protein
MTYRCNLDAIWTRDLDKSRSRFELAGHFGIGRIAAVLAPDHTDHEPPAPPSGARAGVEKWADRSVQCMGRSAPALMTTLSSESASPNR